MNIEDFLNKKIKFEKIIEFPKTPVILFEPMLDCYKENSYAEKLGINYNPSGIVLQDNVYEAWIDNSTKVTITDLTIVEQVILDVRLNINKSKKALSEIKKISNKQEAIEVLNQLSKITSDIYDRFVFFTDELFLISDIKLIQELQQVRMELDDLVTSHLWPTYDHFIKSLDEKLKLDINVINNATVEELIKTLQGAGGVNITKDRKIAFVFINGKKITFLNDDVLGIEKYLNSQNPQQVIINQAVQDRVIKGQVGNSGVVTGKVVLFLVSDYQNQQKLNELERNKDYILVTPMTQPELIKYMKKAAAFVTDEGGITCHAAIIAREMNKPCIIGTKIATQILKDGMEVEVDADNGVVKIINN